jgi:hypothetical protein
LLKPGGCGGSESEKQRRAEQRRLALAAQGPLLHDRTQARFLLGGVSISTLRRLERKGLLRPLKPTGSAGGKTFYTRENILEVADGTEAAR